MNSSTRRALAVLAVSCLSACGGSFAPVSAPIASSATVRSQSLLGLPLGPADVPATSADAFVSSMGVDVDLVTPPTSEATQLGSLFAGLGLRHTRIAILESDARYDSVVNAFFAKNPTVTAYGITNCAPPLGPYPDALIRPSDVAAFQSATGNHVDRVEAVNEPDGTGDPTWAADTRSCVAPLLGGVGGVPLVAPALVTQLNGPDELALGSLSSGIAYGNIHRYFAGRNPDTPGWGGSDSCGVYGALAWAMCWAKVTSPAGPPVVTETGWNSASEVDEATQAKYIERLFFVNAQAGIAATSLSSLTSNDGDTVFGEDGIVRPDLSPKPSYAAITNLTSLLADPGSTYVPASFALSTMPHAATSGSGLRSMLLGKRDGSYYLALWQEAQSANPNAYGVDTVPAAENVTIALAEPCRAIAHAWQDDGTAPSSALGIGSAFAVSVTDRMTILELHPLLP